jgi:hypothetical protein
MMMMKRTVDTMTKTMPMMMLMMMRTMILMLLLAKGTIHAVLSRRAHGVCHASKVADTSVISKK